MIQFRHATLAYHTLHEVARYLATQPTLCKHLIKHAAVKQNANVSVGIGATVFTLYTVYVGVQVTGA